MQRLNNESPTSTTIQELCEEYKRNNVITQEEYQQHRVKRGLRNADGTGVMAGLTHVCNVHGYLIADGDKIPDTGQPHLPGHRHRGHRGRGCEAEDRFGFEEVVWLLIFGKLPNRRQFDRMCNAALRQPGAAGILSRGHDHQGPLQKHYEQAGPVCPGPVLLRRRPRRPVFGKQHAPEHLPHRPHALHHVLRLPGQAPPLRSGEHVLPPLRARPLPPPRPSSTPCAPTGSSPGRRPSCWTCAWCSTPSTAAATTPPSPPGCSPARARTSTPPSARRWAP